MIGHSLGVKDANLTVIFLSYYRKFIFNISNTVGWTDIFKNKSNIVVTEIHDLNATSFKYLNCFLKSKNLKENQNISSIWIYYLTYLKSNPSVKQS